MTIKYLSPKLIQALEEYPEHKNIIRDIRSSIKFHIDNIEDFDIEITQDTLPLMRFPFNEISWEFVSVDNVNSILFTKVVGSTIYSTLFLQDTESSGWGVLPVVASINLNTVSPKVSFTIRQDDTKQIPQSIMGEFADALTYASRCILATCIFLNCSNTEVGDISPSELKKKRARKKDQELDVYKVLKINKKRYLCASGTKLGKTQRRKFHLRRGHIRHYKSGVNLWIPPCSVGEPSLGTIKKEYKV